MRHIYLSAALLTALSMPLFSCSSDNDNNNSLPELGQENVYSGKNLDLEYSDEPMSGKTVKLVKSGNNYSLVLYSSINPGELSAALSKLPSIPGPGVLPGSPELIIPVKLHQDGDEYDFEGTYSTEYATFSYSGDIKRNIMELDIDNVRLKNSGLTGTAWQPVPFKSSLPGIVESTPVYIDWQTSAPLLAKRNIDIDPGEFINILASLPLIPVYNNTARTSVAELITEVLKTVGFRADGNVIINYVNTSFGAAQLATFPQNMLQYVVTSPSEMLLYPNPTDIYAEILNNGSRASSSTLDALFLLAEDILPMFSKGFPVNYKESNSNLTVTIGNDVLLPVFKNLIASLIENPDVLQSLMATIEADPEMAKYAPILDGAIQQLPQLLLRTSKFEIGLKFQRYK